MPELGSRSTTLLTFLLRLPRLVLILGVMALVLAGAFLPGVFGAAFIVLIAALVAWLAWLGWDSAAPMARLGRAAVVGVLLLLAVLKV
ncbi:DUF6703 family protein [Cryptosporangium arvum]|uniref:Uncharacterized protein n=1 Tax=Cryptosporangium arvum DSM 44712 TaxID=927661 RepID=A0A011AEI7_9ACTN|nr:DUF6703 family protein [Cryptosporangium arvum]EXG80451.1 hypothetical protein CryarDRAFT_1525 [Cryptosporangium arvum DSM 44712]